jgi:multiple sugar transport system substrate-binding protein
MTDSQDPKQRLSRRSFLRGIVAAAGTSALLAACGGTQAGSTTEGQQAASGGTAAPAQSSGGKETVVWMSNQRHDRAVKEELFKQFEEKTGIHVDMQIFADEYGNQLQLAFESGTPPDIYNITGTIRDEVEAGRPEPLNDYLAKTPGLEESFLPGAYAPSRGTYNGQKIGLPMYAQTMRLYYNKSIFQKAGLDPNKPPTTFSELRQMSKQITDALKQEGVYGYVLGDKYDWVWWMNGECMGNSAGGYIFDYSTAKYTQNNDGLKQAMQLMVDMQADGSIFPGIHTLTDDDARQQFSLGKAGMIVGGSWNPGVFNDQFQSKEDWETAELPMPDSGTKGKVQQGIGDRYTLSAKSQKKEAAWELLKFMYSPEIMTTMYEKGMGVMAVAKANTGKSDVRGIAKLAPTERDIILPPAPALPAITPGFTTVLQSIWDDKGTTADQKLAEIEKVHNDTFDKEIADGKLKREDYIVKDLNLTV